MDCPPLSGFAVRITKLDHSCAENVNVGSAPVPCHEGQLFFDSRRRPSEGPPARPPSSPAAMVNRHAR